MYGGIGGIGSFAGGRNPSMGSAGRSRASSSASGKARRASALSSLLDAQTYIRLTRETPGAGLEAVDPAAPAVFPTLNHTSPWDDLGQWIGSRPDGPGIAFAAGTPAAEAAPGSGDAARLRQAYSESAAAGSAGPLGQMFNARG